MIVTSVHRYIYAISRHLTPKPATPPMPAPCLCVSVVNSYLSPFTTVSKPFSSQSPFLPFPAILRNVTFQNKCRHGNNFRQIVPRTIKGKMTANIHRSKPQLRGQAFIVSRSLKCLRPGLLQIPAMLATDFTEMFVAFMVPCPIAPRSPLPRCLRRRPLPPNLYPLLKRT